MIENLRPEKENKLKIEETFLYWKELNYTTIKDIRNLFGWEEKTKGTKDWILRDIKNLFEHEEEI